MQIDVIFVLAMIIALVASVICLREIFTASKSRSRLISFGKYAACVTVFLVCAVGFAANNNLLWFGQNPDNANIEMNINTETVEQSSFLHLLEKLDATATVDDVLAIMGNDYEENDSSSYVIRYVAPNCTIDEKEPMFVSFTFNKKRTEILRITWSYKTPSSEMFAQTLAYLENNAFGKATVYKGKTADWQGLHLEDTGEYLLLQRVF